ncbi:tyrosine-type recombinase/integrase [Gaiella sp.]|uniref:tyrosine-type recombinase/integrase n=1 Tax=Gaiella sp. TaxID=2663207 RepID=UPI0039835949
MARKPPPARPKGQPPPNAGKNYPKRFLTPEEVEALLNAFDPGPTGVRNRAIIAFLYRTGTEISEALNRTRSDLHLDEPGHEWVSVHGMRGRSPRTLALDQFVLRELNPDPPIGRVGLLKSGPRRVSGGLAVRESCG